MMYSAGENAATWHLSAGGKHIDARTAYQSSSMHDSEQMHDVKPVAQACLRCGERLATTLQAAAELCLAASEGARAAELLLRAGALDRAAPLVAAADSIPLYTMLAQACEGVPSSCVIAANILYGVYRSEISKIHYQPRPETAAAQSVPVHATLAHAHAHKTHTALVPCARRLHGQAAACR